jgi:hypothetical protein
MLLDKANPDARSDAGSTLKELDFHLFSEGTHTRIYEKLGSHLTERDGVRVGTQRARRQPDR